MRSVLETLQSGTEYLKKHHIEDARRNMEHLIAHQLQCTRMQLYVRFEEPLSETHLAPLRDMLKKRSQGIPLQHILGKVSFLNHEFLSDSRALIPRPETEELTDLLIRDILPTLPPKPHIADIGCGSGIIGISLALANTHASVTLIDISPDALNLAKQNAEQLNTTNTTFLQNSLLHQQTQTFDLIVANLPYIPEHEKNSLTREVLHDPHLALFGGPDGLDLIRTLIPQAFTLLNPNGWLALEIAHNQAPPVLQLLQQTGFSNTQTKLDFAQIPRFPIAQKINKLP